MENNELNIYNIRNKIIFSLIGIISVVVSGLVIHYFTTDKLELTYDSTPTAVFPGEEGYIGIFNITVSNTGDEEIEDCLCRLVMKDAKITNTQVSGLPPSSFSKVQTPDEVEITVPYLNPGEQFVMQTLVNSEIEKLDYEALEVRGKGVVGTMGPLLGRDYLSVSTVKWIISIMGGLLALSVGFLLAQVTYKEPDYRDSIAYILGQNGFTDQARMLRQGERKVTYRSISDQLTEEWLAKGDCETTKQGTKTLTQILEMLQKAGLLKSSKTIINLNIAKLADAVQDQKLAKKHFEIAQGLHQKTFAERLSIDSQLAEIQEKLIG
jgi:hypothetical protein